MRLEYYGGEMLNTNEFFEIVGELYHHRFHRLRPGKDDPVENSSDPANVKQFNEWVNGPLAFNDAIEQIAILGDEYGRLDRDCDGYIEDRDRLQRDYALLVSEHERTERDLAAVISEVEAYRGNAYYQSGVHFAEARCEKRIRELEAALRNINLICAHAPPCDELDEDGDTYNSLLDSIQRHCRTPSAPTAPTPYTGSITDSDDVPRDQMTSNRYQHRGPHDMSVGITPTSETGGGK